MQKCFYKILMVTVLTSDVVYAASQSQASSFDASSLPASQSFGMSMPELPFATQISDYERPVSLGYGSSLLGSQLPASEMASLSEVDTPAAEGALSPTQHYTPAPSSQGSVHTEIVPPPVIAPGALRRTDGPEYSLWPRYIPADRLPVASGIDESAPELPGVVAAPSLVRPAGGSAEE